MGYPARKIDTTQFKHKQKRQIKNPSIRLVNKKQNSKTIKIPKYFTYIVRVDGGLAPNPFYGFCTLAVCKTGVRKNAEEGDWIIGLYSQNKNKHQNYRGKLIYAMKVEEKMTFSQYWKDRRFLRKKQNTNSAKGRCGDNMYYKTSNGDWIQKTYEAHNTPGNRKMDTSVDAVLVSKNFFYLGRECIDLPQSFQESVSKLKPGYKYKGLENEGKKLIKLLEKRYKRGRHGYPIDYEKDKHKCGNRRSHKDNTSHEVCRTSSSCS